ncbi:hypothetical protein [Streptomyces sp. NBC_01212]|uniref:hypothetical protein n=1 Tax=Streptomyces sp. NBC_01212 TaxID=2903775 RepID=UPI002E136F87|nr:hypothetical protein OG722_05170 [Streptomyces sp. NBC_01212]
MTEITPAEAQETEATEEYGTAALTGVDLRVKPVTQWRPSYLRALRTADYDTWSAGVLHEDDVATFVDLDATLDEINEFVAAAMETAGENPGKSSARSTSRRSTRKR